MKTLLIVGNDKIGNLFVKDLDRNLIDYIYLDNSTDFLRVIRMVKNNVLSIVDVIRMFTAEFSRESFTNKSLEKLSNNNQIEKVIIEKKIKRVYLFRAGIVINKRLLKLPGVEFYNIHCAKIPDYGGLAAIARALRDRAYIQAATLHKVIEKIDSGEIIKEEPFQLFPDLSYRQNEDIAYQAGMNLLKRYLLENK